MTCRAAQALARMGRGKPKRFSEEEIARRTERIKAAQKARAEKMREAKDGKN